MNLILIFFLYNITPLSYWTAGNSRVIEKKDSLLFLVSGGTILTFRHPSGIPEFKKEIVSKGTVYDIDFIGDTMFLAGDFGLKILNIQNVNNPQLLGIYDRKIINSYENIYPYGYGVSMGNIIIFNLNTQNPPETLFTYALPGLVTDIKIYGNIGFALAEDTLYILNLQNPSSPQIFSKLKTSLYFENLYKRNDSVFVLTGDSVRIYNIQNPSSPQFLYGFQTMGYGEDIELSSNTAIIALSFSGIGTYNINTGAEINHNYQFSNCISLTKYGSYVYTADLDRGLLTLSYPSLTSIDSFKTPQITYNSKVIGDSILVLASGKGGIFFIDIKNIQKPTYINSINTPGTAFDVEVYQDTILFVADGIEGVRVYNIKNLNSPVELGYTTVNGYAKALSLNFPLLYTANGPGYGFSILNVSDPTKPAEIRNYTTSGSGEDVIFYAPGYLFLADGSTGIHVFDVSDTNNIQLITTLTSYGSSKSLKINGTRLAVAEGYGHGFSLWDISSINNPQFYSNYSTPGFAMDIEFIHPDTLVIADGADFGLRKIFIGNLSNPTEVEYYLMFGEPRGLYYLNGILYTSLGPLGVSIINPHITGIKEKYTSQVNFRSKKAGILSTSIPEFLRNEKYFFSISGRKTKKIKKGGIYFIKSRDNLYKLIILK